MRDLRPDLVFVVSAPVWAAYRELRSEHDPLSQVFLDTCLARAAEAQGDTARASMWQQVARLAELYAPSWVSAIEVEGELIREAEKHHVLRYPEDADLTRVVIADDTPRPLPPDRMNLTLHTPPQKSPDGSLRLTLKAERRESEAGTDSSGLSLSVAADGAIRIEGFHAGPSAKAFWGDYDHEFWLTIPPGHLLELLALVLRHACNATAPLDWTQLRQLLEAGKIPHEERSW